jgi:PDZ domain-containing protein
MTRRRVTLVISAALLVVLVAVGFVLPVPYVILLPGPVTDTLGNVPQGLLAPGQSNGPVISIRGRSVQPSSGHLYLTTVDELPGSCNDHPSLWRAVEAWLSRTQTVDPQQIACPPGQSAQAVRQQGEAEMTQSQSDAETAALYELGYSPTSMHLTVGDSVSPGEPADGVLDPGDVIDSVNGTTVTSATQLQSLIRARPVGSAVTFVITRDGKRMSKTLHTADGGGGTPIVGITVDRTATFPGVSVRIAIDPSVVGGPSAGTALALGIIDKLTAGGLTGGRTIAGTGTVDGFGTVGPIGGIQQKVAAAARAHASVFFSPTANCADAKSAAPSSMTLVKVDTLHTAVKALSAIKAGSSAFPHC